MLQYIEFGIFHLYAIEYIFLLQQDDKCKLLLVVLIHTHISTFFHLG
jgi:hypothetical protein